MVNQTVSQRPKILTIKEEDLLLVSQKQPNNSYLTCSMEAKEIMGSSAYTIWLEEQTTLENYYLNNTSYEIYRITQLSEQNFITKYNLQNEYNNYVENKTYNNYEYLTEYINQTNNTVNLNTYITNKTIETSHLISFLQSNQNYINNYKNYIVDNFYNDIDALKAYLEYSNNLEAFKVYLENELINSYNLNTYLDFLSNSYDSLFTTYLINTYGNNIQIIENFITEKNLTYEYNNYVSQNDTGDTLINLRNYITSYNYTNALNYYIKNNLTISDVTTFLELNFLKNEFRNYLTTITSSSEYIEYLSNNNLVTNYETWLPTYNNFYTYNFIKNFIDDEYPREYSSYSENNLLDVNAVLQILSFLESIDALQDYEDFIYYKYISLSIEDFLKDLVALEFINKQMEENQTSIEEITESLQLTEVFQTWVEDQLKLLNENEFIKYLKGFDGTGSILNKYTEVWLAASATYNKPKVDPNNPPQEPEEPPLLFGLSCLPEKIYIRFDSQHTLYSTAKNLTIDIKSTFKNTRTNEILTSIQMTKDENNEITFNPSFSPEDVILIEKNTPITFKFSEEPEDKTLVAVTFQAKKIRSYASSVNGLMLEGQWKIHDNILGTHQSRFYNENNRLESRDTVYADLSHFFKRIFHMDDAYKFEKVYACSTHFNGFEQIVNINNISPVRRVLTLTPIRNSSHFLHNGRLLSDPEKLPVNVTTYEDGRIEIILAAWED